jgi:hypothetical protein
MDVYRLSIIGFSFVKKRADDFSALPSGTRQWAPYGNLS